jgi:hypothetical protein
LVNDNGVYRFGNRPTLNCNIDPNIGGSVYVNLTDVTSVDYVATINSSAYLGFMRIIALTENSSFPISEITNINESSCEVGNVVDLNVSSFNQSDHFYYYAEIVDCNNTDIVLASSTIYKSNESMDEWAMSPYASFTSFNTEYSDYNTLTVNATSDVPSYLVVETFETDTNHVMHTFTNQSCSTNHYLSATMDGNPYYYQAYLAHCLKQTRISDKTSIYSANDSVMCPYSISQFFSYFLCNELYCFKDGDARC